MVVHPGPGSRIGFGSLLLARPDRQHGWVYAGRVGSGFSDAALRRIAALIGAAGGRQPSVHVPAHTTDLRAARWFAPRFVVEVEDRGRSDSGLLRQPSFKTLREDKTVDDLQEQGRGAAAGDGRQPDEGAGGAQALAALELSHPDRVVYPAAGGAPGVRKGDVASYYAQVMDWLLPQVAGRPLSVVRCPDGIAKACFFQKHTGPGMDQVGHVRLQESDGGKADYLVVDDAAGLLQLMQLNALEFHPWGSHADRPDRADRLVFDLDPGPGIRWPQLRQAARQLRDRLQDVDLAAFLRTTGGKGLHVVVPLQPACDWTLVRRFARGFAEDLVSADPERYVAVAVKAKRKGRIFIDYLRTGRGARHRLVFAALHGRGRWRCRWPGGSCPGYAAPMPTTGGRCRRGCGSCVRIPAGDGHDPPGPVTVVGRLRTRRRPGVVLPSTRAGPNGRRPP